LEAIAILARVTHRAECREDTQDLRAKRPIVFGAPQSRRMEVRENLLKSTISGVAYFVQLLQWRRKRESAMESAMTAAANIEIFLASLGMAALLAYGALRAAFHLMVNAGAGAGAGRHYTVRPGSPSGELALAPARGGQDQGHSRIR
jgi:hypothetical protein